MKKFNIILALSALLLGLISAYINIPAGNVHKTATNSTKSLKPIPVVKESSTTNIAVKNTIKTENADDKLQRQNIIKSSSKDIKEYTASEFEDEEIYGSDTQILSTEKNHDNFYKRVKDSIVEIKNKNTTFYGVVTKDRQGIQVITDLDTANDSATVSIQTLSGEKLNIHSAKKSGKSVAFKLKSPIPTKLKPMLTIIVSKGKTMQLAAFSFDYGTEPEITIGKGKINGDEKCQISSALRRCRPGTPLFTTRAQLYGIINWTSTGNAGSHINKNLNWEKIQYPFKISTPKKRSKEYSYRRYQ